MTPLAAWLLRCFAFLMAGRAVTPDQVVLAVAIDELARVHAIYRTTLLDDARMTRALAVAVVWKESGGVVDAIAHNGDGGMCAFQITPGWKSLLEDPYECTDVGLRRLRASYDRDPIHPVADYAAGSRFRTAEAQRLSDEREELAELLYVAVR